MGNNRATLTHSELQERSHLIMPLPTVKAKRWWWPPDRKKAKLLTVVARYSQGQINELLSQELVSDLVRLSSKPPKTHTKSAQLTEATQERKDISDA